MRAASSHKHHIFNEAMTPLQVWMPQCPGLVSDTIANGMELASVLKKKKMGPEHWSFVQPSVATVYKWTLDCLRLLLTTTAGLPV